MPFVAQTTIKAMVGTGQLVTYHRGDVIPDFATWDIHARRAHLNLEMVAEQKNQVAALDDGHDADDEAVEMLKCPVCKKTFVGQHALKKHVKKTHA